MTNLSCSKCFAEVEVLKKEMPLIKVPEIKILKIDIPKTPLVPKHVLTGNIPGCNLYHRDLEITKILVFYTTIEKHM